MFYFRYRLEGTKFIKECGNLMNLGYATTHTAIVYFHRFYMFHSFKTFPRYVTACSCLFLAGKVVIITIKYIVLLTLTLTICVFCLNF